MADSKQVRKADWDKIGQAVVDEFHRRKQSERRQDLEEQWATVDRQLDMKFDPEIIAARGESEKWKPELELPMQSEALEILNADARRLLFPNQDSYFTAHGLTTEEYFAKVRKLDLIPGENDKPSTIDQQTADALVEGAHLFYQNLYDYRTVWDQFNAGAFKYGTGIVRARVVRQEKVITDQRRVIRNHKKVPFLVAASVKDVLLDDSQWQANMAGFEIEPAVIYGPISHSTQDLISAARSGNTDPNDEFEGGWRPKVVANIDSTETKIIEFEGDLIIERSRDNLVLDNVLVTVALGESNEVIRFRFRKGPRSWMTQPYQMDQLGPYGTGPLMKGAPLQKAATFSFNNLLAAGALNIEPPVAYDSSDPFFAASNGPQVAPRALWRTLDGVNPQQIGDMAGQLITYQELIRQYQDVTGISAPRLGQQTKSHQTATAITSEQERGQVRTVDYVRTVQHGAQENWLNLEYKMIKKLMTKKEMVYIPRWGFYVEMSADALPEQATYDVNGVADPAVTFETEQKRATAIATLIEIEPLAQQAGATPLNFNALRRHILANGKFTDVDTILPGTGVDGGTDGLPAQAAGGPPTPVPAPVSGPSGQPTLVQG